MKKVLTGILVAMALTLVGTSHALANDIEYRKQLIIQEMETKIRLIYAEAQRMLQANDYNNAVAITNWATRESARVREEALEKIRDLNRQNAQPQPQAQGVLPQVPGQQPVPRGVWQFVPGWGWVFYQTN